MKQYILYDPSSGIDEILDSCTMDVESANESNRQLRAEGSDCRWIEDKNVDEVW